MKHTLSSSVVYENEKKNMKVCSSKKNCQKK